tara:strand:- start:22626 stop:24431 length:1806 start_codon:yes stop_codon:yes gene_type:complete
MNKVREGIPLLEATLPLSNWSDANLLSTFAEDGEAQPYYIHSEQSATDASGIVLALTGYPFLETNSGYRQTSATELLTQYQALGDSFLTTIAGRWALLLLDPQQERILFANDRLGRQPLYYSENEGTLSICTQLRPSLAPMQAPDLDEQSIYHFVYFHMIPAPGSAYKNVQKLRMAHRGEADRNGVRLTRYWTPKFTETRPGSRTRLKAALAETLRDSVRRAAHDHAKHKTGAFLSGGLDSSTVAGMLHEVQETGCDAYAIGFDAEGYDEMPYARITARHFGIRLHEYYVTPDDVVAAMPEISKAFEEPFGNSSALPAYFCARRAAADGVSVLLAGDGGDELFAGNERYAHQKLFEHYDQLPYFARHTLIEGLVKILPPRSGLGRKASSFLKQANTPLPARLQYYSFLEQNDATQVFLPEFLRAVDTAHPSALLDSIYHAPEDASSLNRMLFLDWQITLADNDLRKVSKACEMAGVEVRYPMLDDALVSLSTRIPSHWKLPRKALRDFYKQALKGWLPDATIKKSKHGFGLPFGVWMKTHSPLRDMAYEHALGPHNRSIFNPRFLEEAVARHREGHASYYGELVWLLAVLEFWLGAHEVAR